MSEEPKPNKNGLPDRLRCKTPDEPCNCQPGCCNNAEMTLITCSKCGLTAAAFICDTSGCPVNGGAAYGCKEGIN